MKIIQILTRIYVNEINSTIEFYEKLTNEKCTNRFKYNQVGLEIAKVNNFLIVSGTDESLRPFKNTTATILVDSIVEYKDFLFQNDALILQDIQQVPSGFNMTVKHKDNVVIEYVEHKKI